MKRAFCLLALSAVAFAASLPADGAGAAEPVDDRFAATAHKMHSTLRLAALDRIQDHRGSEPLAVLVRVAGPRLDMKALGDARRVLRKDAASGDGLQAETGGSHLGLSAAIELESRAVQRDLELRQVVEGLDGEVARSFWLINGFAARVPAERLQDLAAHPDVLYLERDGLGSADQAASAGCAASGAPSSIPWPGGWWSIGTYAHGGEEEIQQSAAHSVNRGTHDQNINLSVPIAVADSGFDLNTDAWRANVPSGSICWCPNSTGIVSTSCGPGYGPHGTFFTYRRSLAGYFHVSRLRSSFDTLPNDGVNNAEAAFWGAPTDISGFGRTGSNFVGYAHGTQVASIAAGHRYSDQYGDGWAGCLLCPPGFDCNPPPGKQLCPILSMEGVAPEANLHLIKVALDEDQSLSPFSAQIDGVQRALAVGAWIFNLSYESDPYPLSMVAEALDRAAYDPEVDLGLVIVGSAGNRGGDPFPDEIRKGYFNGLIVAATGANAPFNDLVSPGSSHGPRAWPDPAGGGGDVTSGQDGVNISAPGGNWDAQGNVFDGLRTPYPEETYSQANYFNTWFGGVWGSNPVAGTSAASPVVAGVAALVLGEDLTNHDQRTLNQRDVRAILLNQADDISGCNSSESSLGYGQGRVNALASVDFFNLAGILKRGKVAPATKERKRKVTLTAGQPTEITLVWDRVTYPAISGVTGVSNLQLEIYRGTYPGCSSIPCQPGMVLPVAISRHPENNFERVTFTPQVTGTYTIRVVVPNGGFVLSDGSDGSPSGTTPDIPFSLAVIQGSPGICRQ